MGAQRQPIVSDSLLSCYALLTNLATNITAVHQTARFSYLQSLPRGRVRDLKRAVPQRLPASQLSLLRQKFYLQTLRINWIKVCRLSQPKLNPRKSHPNRNQKPPNPRRTSLKRRRVRWTSTRPNMPSRKPQDQSVVRGEESDRVPSWIKTR